MTILRIYGSIGNPLEDYNHWIVMAGFAMVNGPLAWSVLIFRNSLVFHDIDHTITTFIHVSPAVLSWCVRWGAGQGPSVVFNRWHDPTTMKPMWDVRHGGLMATEAGRATADACVGFHRAGLWCETCGATHPFWDFIMPCIALWSVWAAVYYCVVMVWLRDWVEANGKATLYSYMLEKDPVLKAVIRSLGSTSETVRRIAYMLTHLVTTVCFGALSIVFWHSFLLHTIFLFTMLFMAVKHGASFVFTVEMMRYADRKLKEHPEVIQEGKVD